MTARRMSALVAALGLLSVAGPSAAISAQPEYPAPPAPPAPAPGLPSPPTPAFTVSPPVAATGAAVTFDATGSTAAPLSRLVAFGWDFDGDGTFDQVSASPVVTHRYATPGGRDVVLQVVAASTAGVSATTGTTRHHIDVIDHPAPAARIVNPPAALLVGQRVTLHGAATYLSDSDVEYAWEIDGTMGRASASPDLTLALPSAGTHTIRLHVTDTFGSEGVATAVIRAHTPPTAAFAVRGDAIAGQPVVLDASASADDGAVVRHEWDLDGDGTFETDGGTSPTRSVTFPAAGARTVGLRVTDDLGVTAGTTRVVVVAGATDPGPPPPQPTVRAVRGRVAIPVTCPPGPSCAVNVRLRGTGALAGKLLGAATLRVAGGGGGTAGIALSPAAVRELGRAHLLRATLVTRTVAAGRTPVVVRGPLQITG